VLICWQDEEKKDSDKEKDKKDADDTTRDLVTADKSKDSTTDKIKDKEKETTSSTSEKKEDVEKKDGDKKESEPTFQMLSNPARVMKAQVDSRVYLLIECSCEQRVFRATLINCPGSLLSFHCT